MQYPASKTWKNVGNEFPSHLTFRRIVSNAIDSYIRLIEIRYLIEHLCLS